MKCLIINGSPKKNGNTDRVLDAFRTNFDGDIEEINPFSINGKGIQSCLDCGGCTRQKGCVINDDFNKLIKDDYDILLIASPIYMSNLPGPMINIVNRFNFIFNNKNVLHSSFDFKHKKGVLILLGGGSACKKLMGDSNQSNAIKQSMYIFSKLNAEVAKENTIVYLETDAHPVENNYLLLEQVKDIACSLNKENFFIEER